MNIEQTTTKYPLCLQFFSAEGEGRTEQATPKKKEDARKKGQVAKSNELNTAVLLLAFFAIMGLLGSYYLNHINTMMNTSFNNIPVFVLAENLDEIGRAHV